MRPAALIAVRFCLLQLGIAANAGATPIGPDQGAPARFEIEEADPSSASTHAVAMPQAQTAPPRMQGAAADVAPSNRAGYRFADAPALPAALAGQDRMDAGAAAARHHDALLKGDAGVTPWRDQDPLVALGRSLVNVSGHAAHASGDRSASPRNDDGPDPFQIELDYEVRAKLLDMKQAVADVARSVLDPHNDENGRVVFSIAGIEGFQLSSNGGAVSLGIGDTSLGSASSGGPSSPGVYQGERPGARSALRSDANPIRDVIELFTSVIDSPLTWVAGGLVALGWFVFAVMSALAQRELGRGISRSGAAVASRAAGKAVIGSELGRGRRRRRREKPGMDGLSVRPRL